MKFSPLSVIKKKMTFEFIQENNVETETIQSADQLICWVEEENARIIDEESEASVVLIKRDNKERILYAQFIEFPMDSDTDFDSLLDKFYTRKPLQFDQSILEASVHAFSQPVPAPVLPVGRNQQEPVSEPYADVPQIPTAETTDGNPSQEIQQLIAAQKEQQTEIENLKQQLEAERKAVALANERKTEHEVATKEETAPDLDKKDQANGVFTEVSSVAAEKPVVLTASSTNDPNLDFQDRMDQFVAQEKQKIEAEILAVDNRSLIEVDITAKIQREQEEAISRSELDLYEKQSKAIEQEEKRHAEELEKINQDYEKQMDSKRHLLNEKYKRKAVAEVRSEYDRQTKELKQLFNGRMIELKKHQTELSNKLMENIKLAFSELDLEIEDPQESREKEPPTLAEIKQLG